MYLWNQEKSLNNVNKESKKQYFANFFKKTHWIVSLLGYREPVFDNQRNQTNK